MSIVKGLRRLAFLWGSGSFLVLFVLIIETYGKVWGSVAPEAFGWFLLMVVPTLALIVGSVVAEETKATASTWEVTPLAFWLTFWVSVTYLAFVTIAVGAAAWGDKPFRCLRPRACGFCPCRRLSGASFCSAVAYEGEK